VIAGIGMMGYGCGTCPACELRANGWANGEPKCDDVFGQGMLLHVAGRGAQTGRAAVFLRFAGCNRCGADWSAIARAPSKFRDTDFVGVDGEGGEVRDGGRGGGARRRAGQGVSGQRYVVCTGGEPLLQLDDVLISALQARGFEVAVETNGTVEASLAPPGVRVAKVDRGLEAGYQGTS